MSIQFTHMYIHITADMMVIYKPVAVIPKRFDQVLPLNRKNADMLQIEATMIYIPAKWRILDNFNLN